jgi:phage tail-like protein
MNEFYPPVSFYFQVSFEGSSGKNDSSFKEVSGINVEMGLEEIAEGGVNGYKHRVPTTAKYTNLVLKRGLVPKNSAIAKWCMATLGGNFEEAIETKTVIVKLLDENSKPLKSWNFVNAWPVKWALSDLNSMNNEIAVETLELAFSYFEMK